MSASFSISRIMIWRCVCVTLDEWYALERCSLSTMEVKLPKKGGGIFYGSREVAFVSSLAGVGAGSDPLMRGVEPAT